VADYSAKIKLLVEGLQSLDKVEAKVKEIHRLTAGGWRVDLQSSKGYKELSKNLDDIANKGRTTAKSLKDSLKTVWSITKGTGIAAAIVGINQFGAALEAASAKAGLFGPAVQTIGSAVKTAIPGVETLVQAFTALPPALQATAPALAAVTAGLIAFNAPIRTAIQDTVTVAKTLSTVKDAIKTAFNTTLLMAFTDQLDININAADAYRQALLRLTDTVGDLQRRKAALQRVLNNTNSSTDTAVKIATRLVDVTQRLNSEQREQNDLLRRARGLSQTELEETKGVKSLRTRRKRTEYLKEQAEEAAETLANLRALEAAESQAARTRLAAAAKEKADALQAEKVAAQNALTALRALEAAESDLARKRLAASVKSVVDRRGTQAYEFPIGPNPLSGRAFGVDENLKATRSDRIDAAMVDAMRRRREKFYAWEREQPRTVYSAWDSNVFAPAIQGFKKLGSAGAAAITKIEASVKGLGKRLQGSVVGGAFPLLFGQGPEAAIGGALGGLLIPGGGGFAGSLLGTVIGDLKTAQEEVNRLSKSFGYSAQQTLTLASAFEKAGQDADNLKAALVNIQGLGLTSTEEISLLRVANELSEEYGGKVDKIAQALANTLEQGKVTISSITNLTSQGIPVQERLAEKLGVTREELFKLARDGRVSVQDLLDVTVDLGIEAELTADKGKTGFDRFSEASKQLATAVAGLAETLLTILAPAIEKVLNLAVRALTAVNGLLTSGVTRQMGQAGLALLFGFESQGIDNIRSALKDLNKITPTTIDQTDALLGNLDDMRRNLTRVGPGSANAGIAITLQRQVLDAQNRLLKIREGLGGEAGLAQQPIGRITAPVQLPPKSSDGRGGAGAAGREADRVAKVLIQQRALTLEVQRQSTFSAKIAAAERDNNLVLVQRLQGEQKLAELGVQTAKALELEKNASAQLAISKTAQARADLIRQETAQAIAQIEQRINETRDNALANSNERINRLQAEIEGRTRDYELTQRIQELEKAGVENAEAQAQAEFKVLDIKNQQLQTQQLINNLVNSAGQQFAGLFETLITGTNDWNSALRSVLTNLSSALFRFGLNTLADAGDPAGQGIGLLSILAGRFGKRANGGPVSAGSPYVVGERGPELFVPGRSGTIVSNENLSGGGTSNVVVNVDASGSNVEGNDQDANQLGKAIGLAVQQELIKQKRPGGLLAGV